jgi:hypothetical protein
MDDRETRATALLDDATRGLRSDAHGTERLVAGGVARGRMLRRRRRAGTALAAAAVVGVVDAGATLSPALRGGGDRGVDVPATNSPEPTPDPARRIGFDVAKGAAVLEALLPEGAVSGAESWGSDGEKPRRGARLLFQGGEVLMVLGRPASAVDGNEERCRVLAGAECALLDDGSWLAAVTGDTDGDSARDRTIVHLVTPDGWILQISAGVAGQGSAPVLTRAELTRIATDPVWFDGQQ